MESTDIIYFLMRWLHYVFGIIWIGHLYYFNFTQAPFFGETDAATKSNAIQKLVPRALWWFRWGAMFTFITGLIMLSIWAFHQRWLNPWNDHVPKCLARHLAGSKNCH